MDAMGEVTGINWAELGDLGVGIVALVIAYLLVRMVLVQWRHSTDAQVGANEAQLKTAAALEKNAQSYDKLSQVFEKSHEREIEFQREVRSSLKDQSEAVQSTHKLVSEIHRKIV